MDLASFQVGPWNEAKKKEKRPGEKKMKTKKFHAKDKEIIQQVESEEE